MNWLPSTSRCNAVGLRQAGSNYRSLAKRLQNGILARARNEAFGNICWRRLRAHATGEVFKERMKRRSSSQLGRRKHVSELEASNALFQPPPKGGNARPKFRIT